MSLLFDGTAEGVPIEWQQVEERRWRPVGVEDADNFGWLLAADENNSWTLYFNCCIAATATHEATHPALVRVWRYTCYHSVKFIHKPSFLSSSTEDEPHDLHDIGIEFFLYQSLTRVLWYRDPNTGLVQHSGAKSNGRDQRLGCRYCSLCGFSFSANNFVSQHLRCCHPEVWTVRLLTRVIDQAGLVADRGSEEADIFFEFVDLAKLTDMSVA